MNKDQFGMMKRIFLLLLVALLINYVNSSAETTNQGSALPTIQIRTLSGVLPSAEVVDAPENCWGSSIVNNEYEECVIEFINPGHENIVSKGRIRVRGNTSTTGTEKKSYKIKFDDGIDLFDRGDYNYDDKNWALLNNGDKLSTLIGSWVAKYCGVEYVPEVMLVNVVINEDWRGLYYLSEMVNRSQKRMNISDNGFIVENNAYWWKEDHYFKIPDQIYPMGFTFKYPDNPTEEEEEKIQDRIEEIFGMINSRDFAVESLIDGVSFAAYIMTRDILRQGDGGGSNMFYSLYSMDQDGMKYQLKMLPVWDFDSGLVGSKRWFSDVEAAWSTQHVSEFAYFPQLFEMDFFYEQYKTKWNQIHSALLNDFHDWIDWISNEYGDSITIGRQREAKRWRKEVTDLEEEIQYDLLLIEKQIRWIDSMICAD